MVLSTAHGASTLFAAEWNDAVFALKYLDSTVDHARYSSAAMGAATFDATSTAHGLLPVLTGESSKFLSSTGAFMALTSLNVNQVSSAASGICPLGTTVSQTYLSSTGGWNDMGHEMWKRYTTGTATTMFSELSTFVSELATVTSWAYPLYVLRIPPFVQQSKVDLSVGICSCSSNVVSTYAVLFMQGAPRPGSNQPIDPKTTVTLSTKVSGVLWGYFPTTSAWATFTTQITISGGQVYTFYALSTTAPKLKIRNILITGTTDDPQYPADVWTTAWGSTVG